MAPVKENTNLGGLDGRVPVNVNAPEQRTQDAAAFTSKPGLVPQSLGMSGLAKLNNIFNYDMGTKPAATTAPGNARPAAPLLSLDPAGLLNPAKAAANLHRSSRESLHAVASNQSSALGSEDAVRQELKPFTDKAAQTRKAFKTELKTDHVQNAIGEMKKAIVVYEGSPPGDAREAAIKTAAKKFKSDTGKMHDLAGEHDAALTAMHVKIDAMHKEVSPDDTKKWVSDKQAGLDQYKNIKGVDAGKVAAYETALKKISDKGVSPSAKQTRELAELEHSLVNDPQTKSAVAAHDKKQKDAAFKEHVHNSLQASKANVEQMESIPGVDMRQTGKMKQIIKDMETKGYTEERNQALGNAFHEFNNNPRNKRAIEQHALAQGVGEPNGFGGVGLGMGSQGVAGAAGVGVPLLTGAFDSTAQLAMAGANVASMNSNFTAQMIGQNMYQSAEVLDETAMKYNDADWKLASAVANDKIQ